MNDFTLSQINCVAQVLKQITEAEKLAKALITSLVMDIVGFDTAMTFNDETGFPYFNDDADGPIAIAAIKVAHIWSGKTIIFFNAATSETSDDGVDADGWFVPEDFGTYDIHNLFDVVSEWINVHK